MEFPRSVVLLGWAEVPCIDGPWYPDRSCFWWIEYFCATYGQGKGGLTRIMGDFQNVVC